MPVTRTNRNCPVCNMKPGIEEFNGRCVACEQLWREAWHAQGHPLWCRYCGGKLSDGAVTLLGRKKEERDIGRRRQAMMCGNCNHPRTQAATPYSSILDG